MAHRQDSKDEQPISPTLERQRMYAPQYQYPPQQQYYQPMPPPGSRPYYPPPGQQVYAQPYPGPYHPQAPYGAGPYAPAGMYYPPHNGYNPAADPGYYMPTQGDPYYDPQPTGQPPAYGNQGVPPHLIPVPRPTVEELNYRTSSIPTGYSAAPQTIQQQHSPAVSPIPSPNMQHAPPSHRASVASFASGRESIISIANPPSDTNSNSNGHRDGAGNKQDDSQGYLPVIPASPLILQQQTIGKTLSGAEATLAKAIEQRQDLATIRRLTENVNVGKSKLEAVGRAIREAQSKLVTDITPKEMAVAITAFDSDMLEFIRPTDLANHAADPQHPPYPIKSSLDFGYYIRRLVQITVVVPSIAASRVRAIQHWMDVAKELQKLRNFQSYGAVVSGLKSPCVQRLEGTWSQLSKRQLSVWNELRHNMSSDDSFKIYRNMLSMSRPPCIPRLDIFLHALSAPGGLEPGKKEYDFYRSKTYEKDLESRDPAIQHWIVVQNWKSEEALNTLAEKQEPGKDRKDTDEKERQQWLSRLTRAGELNG
ncbi:hypothetical protein SmJEL517_g05254 [Synchytrium microbalum]|uniref:Ras-GEF domain-containing protein n=1 Tax=Synchytrium microbalum TaxID=1806994 RepID=A0A507C1H8_9FUNG|nr:uncharacterized protein SmJEL517_g05254 [Synchytrium microbalum]TPX31425.1 hypothetical protein SmJEL517_g05254 [Synchytrium microbalum]